MKANVLVETVGLSHEEWLNYRRMGIGGSDVSALLGISKWKSALELWLEKTGQTEDLTVSNEAMEWGTIMEPIIREHFKSITGKKTVEVNAILQSIKYGYMLANVDGLTEDDNGNPAILEVKTASEYKRSEWENAIPTYYQTQVQHYLAVTELEKAYVAVLIGGNTFRLYEVDADKEIQQMLIKAEGDFWHKVTHNIRPDIDGSDAAKEFLDKTYTGGNKTNVELPETAQALIQQYIAASAEEDNAKAKKQDATNRLKDMMGNNEKATCGKYTLSWSTVKSERFDSKALKEADPELYAKYAKTGSSRRFSVK